MTTLQKYNGSYDYQDGFNNDPQPVFTDFTESQISEALDRLDTLVTETRKELND